MAARAQHADAPSHHFVEAVAGNVRERGIDGDHDAVGIRHHHGLAAVLVHQRRELRHGLFLLAPGNVEHHPRNQLLSVGLDARAKDLDIDERAVLAACLALIADVLFPHERLTQLDRDPLTLVVRHDIEKGKPQQLVALIA